MNLFHFALGISFYQMIWLIVSLEKEKTTERNLSWLNRVLRETSLSKIVQWDVMKNYWTFLNTIESDELFGAILSIVFLLIQYLQWKCHYEMSKNVNRSVLPNYWMFKYVVCPNYFFECLIYLCFYGYFQNEIAFEAFLFVLINQTMSAIDRKTYYKDKNCPKYAIFFKIV